MIEEDEIGTLALARHSRQLLSRNPDHKRHPVPQTPILNNLFRHLSMHRIVLKAVHLPSACKVPSRSQGAVPQEAPELDCNLWLAGEHVELLLKNGTLFLSELVHWIIRTCGVVSFIMCLVSGRLALSGPG
jgi:hypothetical protein